MVEIAVIGGDGIGPEVTRAGVRVLEAAAKGDPSLELSFTEFPWGCEYYLEHERMMPEDALDALAGHDAIFLGAVGWPTVPDHVSLWGLLLPIRRSFDQYVNLRPARLLRGVKSPLAAPGQLDITVVRENTEGEYSDSGGRVYRGRRTRSRSRRASLPAAGSSGSSGTPLRRRRPVGDFSSGPRSPTG
jgi:tartrate dehydrogenase/decarboxylase/D-malate dehydrogenase